MVEKISLVRICYATRPNSLKLIILVFSSRISDRCCPAVHSDRYLVPVLCCTVSVHKPLCIRNKKVLSQPLSLLRVHSIFLVVHLSSFATRSERFTRCTRCTRMVGGTGDVYYVNISGFLLWILKCGKVGHSVIQFHLGELPPPPLRTRNSDTFNQ